MAPFPRRNTWRSSIPRRVASARGYEVSYVEVSGGCPTIARPLRASRIVRARGAGGDGRGDAAVVAGGGAGGGDAMGRVGPTGAGGSMRRAGSRTSPSPSVACRPLRGRGRARSWPAARTRGGASRRGSRRSRHTPPRARRRSKPRSGRRARRPRRGRRGGPPRSRRARAFRWRRQCVALLRGQGRGARDRRRQPTACRRSERAPRPTFSSPPARKRPRRHRRAHPDDVAGRLTGRAENPGTP